jgi:Holliday junction resolvase RusA-like endonuclease
MGMKLELPWPSKDLSPNGRVHWARKAKAAKAGRITGAAIAAAAGWKSLKLPAGRLHLWIDFYPPTRMRPDDDNMLARCKPYRDGIADALGIDDRRFVSHPFVRDEVRKGGLVVIRITGGPEHE